MLAAVAIAAAAASLCSPDSPPTLLPCCSGSIERMCRRWRRLALQLPASLSIDLEQLEDLVADQEACAATVERLLPHLRCRNIVAMKVCNWTSCLAPEVPALLARAIYPELLRWVPGAKCWLSGGVEQQRTAPGFDKR